MIIDGKQIAKKIIDRLKTKPVPQKNLAAILVGDDPASVSFLKQKEKVAKELGVDFRLYAYKEEDFTADSLRKEIGRVSGQKSVGGVIVQLPLPAKFNQQYALNALDPVKDIDVLGERSLGAFYAGRSRVLPPAVETLKEVLKEIGFDLDDKKVGVVGLGLLVGKPISVWLMKKTAEVRLFDSKSDLGGLKTMDLIVSGVGKANLINGSMVKRGVGIVDFGYDFSGGKIRGDADVESLADIASFITPTPGGTGPILVSKLFENFFVLNEE